MSLYDHVDERRLAARNELTGDILERRLVAEFRKRGWELISLKYKWKGDKFLVIIERETPQEGLMVAFTNGSGLATATRTVYSLVVQDKLNWREPRTFTK